MPLKALLGAHLPKLVFCLVLLPGLAVTLAVYSGSERRLAAEFERTADLAVDRVVSRLEQHVVVLRAARGLISAARNEVGREEFQRFLSSVDIVHELSGVQGIGFARMLAPLDDRLAETEIRDHYGIEVKVRPETDQKWRTAIVLLEPANDRNLAALGYDMYADPTRRSAMDRAMASGAPQMTGPVELVQEITEEKQTGFLIYLPFEATGRPQEHRGLPVIGFVYAPFRGGDLIRAALSVGPPLPIAMRLVDAQAAQAPLFDTFSGSAGSTLRHIRRIEILGRTWVFDIAADPTAFGQVRHLTTVILGLVSILFATAVAYAVAARQHEAMRARESAAAAVRVANYRELLLQEMKHRIKNHIARIQSIARQSARGATDVQAFMATFDARLLAMSGAQEVLAGTASAGAEVRAILLRELQQSADAVDFEQLIDGPTVRLDERQSHAFALVVHELFTNAMKYGGLSPAGSGLRVRWSVQAGGASPEFDLDWEEQVEGLSTPARAPGFGSRLIEATLKGELSGSIRRDYRPDGLTIHIGFPLDPALNGPST